MNYLTTYSEVLSEMKKNDIDSDLFRRLENIENSLRYIIKNQLPVPDSHNFD